VTEEGSQNPLRALFDIRREELPQVLLMFLYFFLVITTFWVLKPLKKSTFIETYDASGFDLLGWDLTAAQAELLAKVLNMFVAYVAAVVFGALSDRYHRHQLTTIFGAFFIAGFLIYAPLLNHPAGATVWTFYLFGDLFSTLMVVCFFSFLNDIVTPDSAKRTYGAVLLGGVIGGAVGSMGFRSLISAVSPQTWLLVCTAMVGMIIVLGQIVGRRHERLRGLGPVSERRRDSEPDPHSAGNPAFEGARLILRSRYLLSLVGMVVIYEMVSTILDFQFSATVSHYLDGDAIGKRIGLAFAIMNGAAMLVQLFLTSFVMTRLGVKTALMVLPVTTLLASGGFMALPVLWVGTLIPTLDGAFSYSINQSAKEALYVPTTRQEKYKAKAFIDMFAQRVAKAMAVGLALLMTLVASDFSGVRWLSLVTLLLTSTWLAIARYAGNRFAELADEDGAPAGPRSDSATG
jgi:AAA family ATP:ADP antiporter